jgi:hypothetical protein
MTTQRLGWYVVALFFAAPLCFAQNRPLVNPDAEIVPAGTLRVQVGFDFLQGVSYPLSGLSGDQTNLGVLDARLGLGRIVEVQLTGAIQDFLQVDQRDTPLVPLNLTGNNSTRDTGDYSLLTKVRLLSERGWRPAAAFRFGVTLPNTNQGRGIGNNVTNFTSEAILEHHVGKLRAFGSMGLAILSAPLSPDEQNDELLYGVGLTYPLTRRVSVVGGVAGRYSTRPVGTSLAGTESRAQGRFGVRILAGGFWWDAAGIAGVYPNDPRSGFTFGVSRDFRLFDRARKP